MNIWILTIGTSDVQLESKEKSRKKGRIDDDHVEKIWQRKWQQTCQDDWEMSFIPSQVVKDAKDPYRIPPRALGEVYQESSVAIKDEIYDYLEFPLLENFLKSFPDNPLPDVIFLLLTDQSQLFPDSLQRRNPRCPYWQDTFPLEAIATRYLQDYFQDQHQTEIKIVPVTLAPEDEAQSLDDWNAVLEMVQKKFKNLAIDGEKLDPQKCDRVYVSHQAGTPAISSAVQFMSLATFRDTVQFLVSRDNQQFSKITVEPFKLIPQSSYLGALRLQEAKALLKRYDYTGVRDILGLTEAKDLKGIQKELKILLDAGEQWSFAEFYKFKTKLKNSKLIETSTFSWWRLGYESALLACVRLSQDNTVEAMFHSFRAMEGMINQWALRYYRSHISQKGDKNYQEKYGPQIQKSICSVLPDFYKELSKPNQNKLDNYKQVGLYGDPLYLLFKQGRPDWKDHSYISIVWDTAKNERNSLFHNIEGLKPQDVFSAWIDTSYGNYEDQQQRWKQCLLSCLNFIAIKDLDTPFSTLEDASIMATVHQKLVEAIDSL